jgi:SAM-dependent methyltransferase
MKRLNAEGVQRIYDEFVLPNSTKEYSTRYLQLPSIRSSGSWDWKGKDFPRVIAVLEFSRMCNQYDLRAHHLLTFNGVADPELHYLPFERVSNFDYADNPKEYDLQALRIPRQSYDFVMLNQTLEHVYNPFLCLENVRDHMAPGGLIYANVPAANISHSAPLHFYTGFTPIGFASLFATCEFELIEVGQWGSVEYIARMWRTQAWPDYRQLRSYASDFRNPAITWVLARKP